MKINIRHPRRGHIAFRTIRIITTVEGLYILLVPSIGRLLDHQVSKTGAIVNLVLGVVFTIISEVVIQCMQSFVFMNRQLIEDTKELEAALS